LGPLLRIRNLRVWFDVRIGLIAGFLGKETKHVRAVDGISFDVNRGEVFCLVGESGCGKTTTGKALLRLNQPTEGNVFFNVPDKMWDQFVAVEQRLREIEPLLPDPKSTDMKRAGTEWSRLHRLREQVKSARSPRGSAGSQARRERLQRAIQILDEREKALLEHEDAAVNRLVSKDQKRVEVMRDLGPWFTIARARKLDRLEELLKEAKYQSVRAKALRFGAGRAGRTTRRLERKIAAVRSHVQTDAPNHASDVDALQRTLKEKETGLTELELARVREEREQLRRQLEAEKPPEAGPGESEIQELEAEIERIRSRGGLAVQALELRAYLAEVRNWYDLTTWGVRGGRIRELRKRMQIIYQDPYESLNPKLSIYDIVSEPLVANHVTSSVTETEAVVAKALEDVGLRPASEYMFRYPHELSGGQRQRVGIATALVVDPDFIVADEPVSMLDASVRTEILALLLELKKRRDLTYLFITHDLGLAWILADRIAVMYLGKIVETGDGAEIIRNPRHPYTKALISVVPSPNPSVQGEKIILQGERPNPVDIPGGCRFHPRCPMAVGVCGWNSEEVRDELNKLLAEDREEFPESSSVTEVAASGPLSVTVKTPNPGPVEKYLWKRLQAVALDRPALAAIRRANGQSGTLELMLHEPIEPPLRQITPNVFVACHLVEPEAVAERAVAVGK